MTPLALDTSVAVPLLVRSHTQHRVVAAWCAGREIALSGHALPETYSVLTRLPGDARVAPADAARLMGARFAAPLVVDPGTAKRLPELLSEHGVAGGAVYDALVALAALDAGSTLATRDARAVATYAAIGVPTVTVG